MLVEVDGQALELDAGEVVPLEACPRCRVPAAPRDVAAIASVRGEHRGSVSLQHRVACSGKGRAPSACSCDPAVYTTVDRKSAPAGRLPLGWTEADLADVYARLPRRRRRASVQLQHVDGCSGKGRDHERCACSPRAYLVVSGAHTPDGRRTYTPAGRLAEGWGPSDVAALLEPLVVDPPVAAAPCTRRPAEDDDPDDVDDHLGDPVLRELERGTCALCRGRGEIGEPLDGCTLYAIDAKNAVRAVTVNERRAGEALHRLHACQLPLRSRAAA